MLRRDQIMLRSMAAATCSMLHLRLYPI